MTSMFETGLRDLHDMGLLDIILPFILIFTVVFAVLQRTKVLGKDPNNNNRPYKNFNVVIALVMGMATVIPHVLWGSRDPRHPYLSNGLIDVVQVINNALPNVGLIIVAMLMFMIVVGIWGTKMKLAGTTLGGIVMTLSVVAVIIIFAVAAGWMGGLPYWLRFLENPQTQALIVVILVFGIIIRFIVGDEQRNNEDKPGAFKKIADALENVD